MLQFLEIDKPMGISLDKLNAFFKGKGSLEGTASAFIEAANEYQINECYLAAHAAIETGNGSSVLGKGSLFSYNQQPSRTVYNMYGIAAVDGYAVGGGKATAYSRGGLHLSWLLKVVLHGSLKSLFIKNKILFIRCVGIQPIHPRINMLLP